jgi:hypothetical protein
MGKRPAVHSQPPKDVRAVVVAWEIWEEINSKTLKIDLLKYFQFS